MLENSLQRTNTEKNDKPAKIYDLARFGDYSVKDPVFVAWLVIERDSHEGCITQSLRGRDVPD